MRLYHPNIGSAIRKRRIEMTSALNGSPLLEGLLRRSGRGKTGTYEAIRYIERGDIYGTTSAEGVRQHRKERLHFLAVYLDEIGFDPADPLVKEIRKIDDRFVYPPQD